MDYKPHEQKVGLQSSQVYLSKTLCSDWIIHRRQLTVVYQVSISLLNNPPNFDRGLIVILCKCSTLFNNCGQTMKWPKYPPTVFSTLEEQGLGSGRKTQRPTWANFGHQLSRRWRHWLRRRRLAEQQRRQTEREGGGGGDPAEGALHAGQAAVWKNRRQVWKKWPRNFCSGDERPEVEIDFLISLATLKRFSGPVSKHG